MCLTMKIIFLSYINRSGSTYLANQLSKSPDFCICPEAEILYETFLVHPFVSIAKNEKTFERIIRTLTMDKKFIHWKLKKNEITEILNISSTNFECFISLLLLFAKKNNPSTSIIVFKNTETIDLINKLSEKIIEKYKIFWLALVRDARAIFYSQKNTISPLTNKRMCSDWFTLTQNWNIYTSALIINYYLKNTIILRYEDLISDTENELLNIIRILDCDYDINWVKNKRGLVFDTLSEEYQLIHPFIDSLPNKARINFWQKKLRLSLQKLIEFRCWNNLSLLNYNVDAKPTLKSYFHLVIIVKKSIWYFKNFTDQIKRIIRQWIA